MDLDNRNIKIKFNILVIACIVLFCFAVTPVTLQNDTFYTIKIGEQIAKDGIDMQDHFSWHEDLPYTYPHWAYDVRNVLYISSRRDKWNSRWRNVIYLYINCNTNLFIRIINVLYSVKN